MEQTVEQVLLVARVAQGALVEPVVKLMPEVLSDIVALPREVVTT